MNNIAALAGRILLALIFLQSGIEKFVYYSPTLGYMTKAAMPLPRVMMLFTAL